MTAVPCAFSSLTLIKKTLCSFLCVCCQQWQSYVTPELPFCFEIERKIGANKKNLFIFDKVIGVFWFVKLGESYPFKITEPNRTDLLNLIDLIWQLLETNWPLCVGMWFQTDCLNNLDHCDGSLRWLVTPLWCLVAEVCLVRLLNGVGMSD